MQGRMLKNKCWNYSKMKEDNYSRKNWQNKQCSFYCDMMDTRLKTKVSILFRFVQPRVGILCEQIFKTGTSFLCTSITLSPALSITRDLGNIIFKRNEAFCLTQAARFQKFISIVYPIAYQIKNTPYVASSPFHFFPKLK